MTSPHPVRAGAVAAGALAAAITLVLALIPTSTAALRPTTAGPTGVDDLVVTLAWIVWPTAAAMLLLCLSLAALDALLGHRCRYVRVAAVRGCPRWVRRLVLGICSVSLVTPGVAAPVWSVPTPRCEPPCPGPLAAVRLHGLPMPDLPTRQGYDAPRHLRDRAPAATAAVIVRSGDSLWRLAAAQLPADANPLAVAHQTARWYGRNHHVVGADPDLIFPGTLLVPPEVRP